MLLICKQSTKKQSSSSGSGSGSGGLKIIRQPYVVDRVRVHELKEPSSLGLVYLNEYGAASAALVLSAGEPKLAKVSHIIIELQRMHTCVWETMRAALELVQWLRRERERDCLFGVGLGGGNGAEGYCCDWVLRRRRGLSG